MKRITLVIGILVVALVGAFALRDVVTNHEDPLVIVHWSNSHPMREGLLPQMAEEFNDADHETASGRPIEIKLVPCDSAVQARDLVSRVGGKGPIENGCGTENPTIVTPQADDWLVDVNAAAGRTVVDLADTKSIAKTWVGIVTYKAMAECLGWPDKEIGYADIIALRADPNGWKSRPCAQVSWGSKPLLAFTNPTTSTTGRSVLISLYSMATGDKKPEDLTLADVEDPAVQSKVSGFQQLVDHYMPGTIPLNTKIGQGTKYGHFFLMPEDNLVNLYKGNEKALGPDGKERSAKPIKNMVMIYPKEGSALNSNPAGIVHAPWVSEEEGAAAQDWADFLREDEQQRAFMNGGFRPGTSLALADPISPEFGLDPTKPTASIDPAKLDPAVLNEIMSSWGAVKKPAILTFVVDTSGSMAGAKLEHAKDGLTRVLDNMQKGNQVGLVTFSDTIETEIPPAALTTQNAFDIAEAVAKLTPGGGTALFDAVVKAVALTDAADGSENGATRAVVVLSDGQDNAISGARLDDIVTMSRNEVHVTWSGRQDERPGADDGKPVAKRSVVGDGFRMSTRQPVQIFFIGFGDADIDVGRVMAQATSAEFQGSTDEDLAAVIEEFGAYF
jgi:Ca-activated chloride channel family protein